MSLDPAFVPILPRTAGLTPQGHLSLGGCDAVDLASEFGTPLYVFDEIELREGAREWRAAFQPSYPDTTIVYAAKAYLGRAVASLFADEGLSLDVASGGELAIALAAGFPAERIYLHGNNKSRRELREALDAGVGHVVIDNFREIALLDELATAAGKRQTVLLRVSPNVDPHTHRYISTGALDSKFGVPLATGDTEAAVEALTASNALDLAGLHAHIGSQIFEIEPFQQSLRALIEFAAGLKGRHRFAQISAGGGFAVQYQRGIPAPSRRDYAEALVAALRESCRTFDLPPPRLVIEPGRSLVARAGVALYSVGGRKEIAGVRTYVLVDGGMADNIRPALYGAAYEALLASRADDEEPLERVTIAGKYCESGDVLVRDIELPKLRPDDLLAIPVAGAYCLPLASNYNASLRPTVVFVKDGSARLVRRRESYDDLLRCECGDGAAD
ncbi:MAG: diaminopimelate decarboxylase [Dehalococcoidia bacterium]|jgi:diaminopimelate decarboxylase